MKLLRQVKHPGSEIFPRILVEGAPADKEFCLVLPAGADFFDHLSRSLRTCGSVSAGVRIIHASFEKFEFVTGVVDPTGYRVATFSETKFPRCPVDLISGNVIVGLEEDGSSKTHCHAVFVDCDGNIHAGHLLPGKCILGPKGAQVWATSSGAACHQVKFDAETNFPIFHPAHVDKFTEVDCMDSKVIVERGQFGRILTARVRPNEDLVTCIEALCEQENISHAEIRSCVGSLMDASLVRSAETDEVTEEITGPGLEITIASGLVRPDQNGKPHARLRGLVANGAGEAFAGEFVRGRNLVFVTLEVVLQEWLPGS